MDTPATDLEARRVVPLLAGIVGEEHVRDAVAQDSVDGVRPGLVVELGSVEESSEVLKLASRGGLCVTPRGGGSKLGWGIPPERVDMVLSTARLNRVIEHASGDLVAKVQAGVKLHDLQAELAIAGQMLALDPPDPSGTIGGIVATNASGPRRLRYGTVRDLLIGITVVLADGTIAKAGGKVVKNVAGYDLTKLFTGSLGTLGLIVEATFRLHPLPEAARTVEVEVDTPEQAGQVLQAVLHSPLVPSAIELDWPSTDGGGTIHILFEGIEPGVEAQARTALELTATHGAPRVIETRAEQAHRDTVSSEPGVRLKVSSLSADLPHILQAILEAVRRNGIAQQVTGHAGNGVLFAALAGDDGPAQVRAIHEIREAVRQADGSLVVLEAPIELKAELDVWGPTGDALPLMRRVKEQFDPARLMNPGRFVGGI